MRSDLRPDSTPGIGGHRSWDVFISHATEDKETVAGPVARALRDLGLRVWYDDFELRIGDSLSGSIDRGVGGSRFGLVILSEQFFAKNWPQYELKGLVSRANSNESNLLPIWHEISRDEVAAYSAPLADVVALSTSGHSTDDIAAKVAAVVQGGAEPPTRTDMTPVPPPSTRARTHGVNSLTLTAGGNRHFFVGVTVTPNADLQGRHYLDMRKHPTSPDDYARLCKDLASTPQADRWHAHLEIGGAAFELRQLRGHAQRPSRLGQPLRRCAGTH